LIVFVISENPEVSIYEFHWAGKVELKTESGDDVLLEICEDRLVDELLIFFRQMNNHSGEGRLHWLVEFGCEEHADGGEGCNLLLWECPMAHRCQVPVENGSGSEQSFNSVRLLLVEVEEFGDSVGSRLILLIDDVSPACLFDEFLVILVAKRVEAVAEEHCFLI